MAMALAKALPLAMLAKTSVRLAGVCLLEEAVENIKHYMINIVALPKAKT
jgi:hypothetical protein